MRILAGSLHYIEIGEIMTVMGSITGSLPPPDMPWPSGSGFQLRFCWLSPTTDCLPSAAPCASAHGSRRQPGCHKREAPYFATSARRSWPYACSIIRCRLSRGTASTSAPICDGQADRHRDGAQFGSRSDRARARSGAFNAARRTAHCSPGRPIGCADSNTQLTADAPGQSRTARCADVPEFEAVAAGRRRSPTGSRRHVLMVEGVPPRSSSR